MYLELWTSMAFLPIVSSTSVCTSAIASPAKKTHPKEKFQLEYENV
jgi:hypothetical protein